MTTDHSLSAQSLSLAYDGTEVVCDLSLTLPSGRITTIVGANACGKSTLLRGLARLMAPSAGRVLLERAADHRPAEPAGRRAPRTAPSVRRPPPEGISVADLVGRGRSPTRAGSARGPRTTSAPSPAPSR
jgi:iron complex transport system ATP-binding protein